MKPHPALVFGSGNVTGNLLTPSREMLMHFLDLHFVPDAGGQKPASVAVSCGTELAEANRLGPGSAFWGRGGEVRWRKRGVTSGFCWNRRLFPLGMMFKGTFWEPCSWFQEGLTVSKRVLCPGCCCSTGEPKGMCAPKIQTPFFRTQRCDSFKGQQTPSQVSTDARQREVASRKTRT